MCWRFLAPKTRHARYGSNNRGGGIYAALISLFFLNAFGVAHCIADAFILASLLAAKLHDYQHSC